jgi:ribonuclease G
MVDFINMESKENNGKLLKALDSYLMEDKIRTRLVDMTALGIVEITRKKVNKPLSEWIL